MELPCNERDIHLFQACTEIHLGDGTKTFFWKDNWLKGRCPKDVTPALFKLAKRKSRNVSTERTNGNWIQSFRQITMVEEIHELVQLGSLLTEVELDQGEEDEIIWKRSSFATYTARSACRAQFLGSQQDMIYLINWKTQALPKQIFLGWLILHHKVLTADNLLIKHWECSWICPLCRSAFEDADHLFRQCEFIQETWSQVATASGFYHGHNHSTIAEWMRNLAVGGGTKKEVKARIGALIKTWWHVWLQRNAKIFRGEEPNAQRTAHLVIEDCRECNVVFEPP